MRCANIPALKDAVALPLLGLLLLTGKATAQTPDICKSVLAKPAPLPPRFTHPLPARVLERCDAEGLYYGYSGRPDYAAALQCGWSQRAYLLSQESDSDGPIGGLGVLSMLYANGFGVEQNGELAARFACEHERLGSGEHVDRIKALLMLSHSAPGSAAFDFCQDSLPAYETAYCALIPFQIAEAKRGLKFAALKTKLPAAAQSELPKLIAAERDFESVRIENEIDLTGTGRDAFQAEDRDKLQKQFLINLQSFAKGKPQPAPNYAAVDRALQASLCAVRHTPAAFWQDETITQEGIAQTQRAWQSLFAAWMRFVPIAYPQLPPDDAAAELIRLRTHQLHALLPTSKSSKF